MPRIIVPVTKVEKLNEYRVYPHFAQAPYFAVIDVLTKDNYKVSIVQNPIRFEPSYGFGGMGRGMGGGGGRGRIVRDFLLGYRPDAVIVTSIGRGAYYWLIESGVKVLKPIRKDIKGIVEDFLDGRLPPLEGPRV